MPCAGVAADGIAKLAAETKAARGLAARGNASVDSPCASSGSRPVVAISLWHSRHNADCVTPFASPLPCQAIASQAAGLSFAPGWHVAQRLDQSDRAITCACCDDNAPGASKSFLKLPPKIISTAPMVKSAAPRSQRPRIARSERFGLQCFTWQQTPSGLGPISQGPPRPSLRLQSQRSPSRIGVHSPSAGQRPAQLGPIAQGEPADSSPHCQRLCGRSYCLRFTASAPRGTRAPSRRAPRRAAAAPTSG
jgi:hypothetical protein